MRVKHMILIASLLLLISISAVSASDDFNSTVLMQSDDSNEKLFDPIIDWEMDVDDEVDVIPAVNQEIDIKNSPFSYDDDEDSYNYSLSIDDKDVEIVKSPSSVRFDASNLSMGLHKFQLKFLGNNFYASSNKTGFLNVSVMHTDIPDEISYPYDIIEDECIIYAYLVNNVSGKLSFFIDDDLEGQFNVTADETSGYHVYSFFRVDMFKIGNFTFRIVFDDGVNVVEKSRKVKIDYPLDYSHDFKYGDSKLYLIVPQQIKDGVSVKINGVNYKVNVEYDDDYIYRFINFNPILNVGYYNFEISYNGVNDKYPKKTVLKTLSVQPVIVYSYITGGFSIKMPKNAKGNLVADIYDNDGNLVKSYSQKVSDGVAELKLSKSGVYGKFAYVIGRYDGSDYNVSDMVMKSLPIGPDMGIPSSMVVGEKKYISLNLPGKEGKLIVTIHGKKYYKYSADLVKGKASISLSKLPAGEYTITTTYKENLNDGKTQVYIDYFNLIVYDHINFVNKDSLYYGDAKLKIQAYGENGKVLANKYITIKINGKYLKKVKTDKKGVAFLKFSSKYLPKKYKITATYNKYKTTQNVKINQVLSFDKLTVRKSAKKLTITVKLAKKTKPIKNKKVTVKFNGKTYKAKTNKKGVAKVTVKKSVLKKLRVGKKVTLKGTYLKSTVTKKLKVKK